MLQLLATPDNPVPPHPHLVEVTTSDGLKLRAAYWLPETDARKGTVCVIQGRAEFIEKYYEVIGELLERGFAVATFDWRGQGLSGRQVKNPRKGHVRRFGDFRRDVEAIRDQVLVPLLPEPHFALAHSMGAAVAINAASEGWLPFRRLVATTPMIAIAMVPFQRGSILLLRLLWWLGLGKSFVPGGGATSISTKPFKGNRLTSDPARYARNARAAEALGDGATGAPTVSWLLSSFRFIRRFRDLRYAPKIRLPILVIAAGSDPICDTPATERFSARLKAGHAIVIPDARHEILMERDEIRAQFWAAFDAFIPGTPSAMTQDGRKTSRAVLTAEKFDGGGVDAPVAGGDDSSALGG